MSLGPLTPQHHMVGMGLVYIEQKEPRLKKFLSAPPPISVPWKCTGIQDGLPHINREPGSRTQALGTVSSLSFTDSEAQGPRDSPHWPVLTHRETETYMHVHPHPHTHTHTHTIKSADVRELVRNTHDLSPESGAPRESHNVGPTPVHL